MFAAAVFAAVTGWRGRTGQAALAEGEAEQAVANLVKQLPRFLAGGDFPLRTEQRQGGTGQQGEYDQYQR